MPGVTVFDIDVPDYFPAPAAALDAAITLLEGGVCPDGSHADGGEEGERAGWEWRKLREWCGESGLHAPAEVTPEREGGREHDVRFVEAERRWWKFTKWNSAGYTVNLETGEPLFLPATPLEYLRRLRLQNQVFGDDWQLKGIQAEGHALRLVTSQPDIVGEAPSPEEMDRQIREVFGYRRLQIAPMGYHKSVSYFRDGLALFDVHPGNAVLSTGGVLVPIDFIIVRFAGAERDWLDARAQD